MKAIILHISCYNSISKTTVFTAIHLDAEHKGDAYSVVVSLVKALYSPLGGKQVVAANVSYSSRKSSVFY